MTQEQALRIMKTGVNVFLTGGAGSGKTFLLNKYIEYLKDNEIPVAVTASTGIASTHMNGVTIHSWSGLGIKDSLDEKALDELEQKKYLWTRFKKTKVLIIDEISMLKPSQLEMVEKICCRFKRSNKPFGGLQIIISGDFFQLPPIFKKQEKTEEILFNSNVWKILNPAICYLGEQFRQKDDTLSSILNKIRSNQIDIGDYKKLEERVLVPNENFKPTKLYTHNIDVDLINEGELAEIEEKEIIFEMTSTGPINLVYSLKKSCIANEVLRVKKGAEVMCIKNNFEEGYVNGSRGKIIGFEPDTHNPIVELYSGKTISIAPATWSIEEDGKIKASVKQIPLRLAWAITIHKSQGMSLDNAEINLEKTFAHGMGYVALSRVRTLSGIVLTGLNKRALNIDPRILSIDQELKKESEQNNILFSKLTKEEQEQLEENFILKAGGERKKENKDLQKKTSTIDKTKELLKEGKSIRDIAKKRGLTTGTILNHVEKIKIKSLEINLDHLRPSKKIIREVKLVDSENKKLKEIKEELEKKGLKISYGEIRLARLFF